MKKTLTIFSLLLAVVFLAGCEKKTEQNAATQNEKASQKSGVITSIKDAMNLGKKMKCTYSMQISGKDFQTEAYVDGKNHKTITIIDGAKNYSVFDGDMVYTWSDKDKMGTKMSMKCMDDLKAQTETNPQTSPSAAENIKANADDFKDAANVSCEPVSSIDLTVPNDVKFTDNCEMLKQSLEMMNKYKNQVPTQAPPQMPTGAFPEGAGIQ
jgi:hypothetical protein